MKNYFNVQGSGKFDFISKTKVFVLISLVAVLVTLVWIPIKGLNYGIDFSGGTEMQVQFSSPVESSSVRKIAEELNLSGGQIQSFPETNEFLIRFQAEQGKTAAETNSFLTQAVQSLTEKLQVAFAAQNPTVRRVDSVGPQVGEQLKKNSMLAAFYCFLVILIYVGLRFDYIYAPGAVICLVHDSIITLGVLAFMGKEINVQILAAILTIIGYSLNDTIVIFDRVRENIDLNPEKSIPWVLNKSMNEMLGRTIMTSATTLAAIACLYFFADGVIRDFAFAMSIGIIAGSYSTIYVASPLVILFDRILNKKRHA